MSRSANPEKFLSEDEKHMVESAVATAESGTSAEIKLVIVRHCWGEIEEKAANLFIKNNLHKTDDRNCVMVMLVLANREFVIFGDVGIDQKVGQEFWDSTRDLMVRYFKEDKFGQGLAEGIKNIGEKLQQFFPHQSDDKNEVSNEIAYEN